MHAPAIVSLLVLGFIALWFGLVEDIELAFAVAVACSATATLMAFSGRPGVIPPPQPRKTPAPTTRRSRSLDLKEMFLPSAIAGAFVTGFAGIWLGLVEDVKIAMLIGIAVWAGAVLAMFKGRADVWRSRNNASHPSSH